MYASVSRSKRPLTQDGELPDGMKVLLIDDDPDILGAISVSLDLLWPGVVLVEASDGKSGIDLARTEQPDVVVLDIGLPDINGFDVYEELRTFSEVPVVMLTARSGQSEKTKGLELGADDYLVKPFSHTDLVARVQAAVHRYESPDSPGGPGILD